MAKVVSKDVTLVRSMGVILNKGDRVISHWLKRSSKVLISFRLGTAITYHQTYISPFPLNFLSICPQNPTTRISKQFSSFKSHHNRRPRESLTRIRLSTFDVRFRCQTEPATLTFRYTRNFQYFF